MKYLVFSDLHGSTKGLGLLKEAIGREKPDVVLCLGDTLFGAYDGDAKAVGDYLSSLPINVIGVRGNCDHYGDDRVLGFSIPEEQFLFFKGHRIWMRHAPFWGDFKDGDIVLFGHTHTKTLSAHAGVTTLNPGSIGKPRDGSYSYAIIEEDHIRLVNAEDGRLIDTLPLPTKA